MLNWLLLVACICIAAATVLYLFYWNRFLGAACGFLIRLYAWNQGASSVWIGIGSLHFSLIAGRILIKDFRYHSSNQTVKSVKVQVTWRYWIRRPTTQEEIGDVRLGEEDPKQAERLQACRIQLSFEGFEWFLYNRTASYENILANLDPNALGRAPSQSINRQASRSAGSAALAPGPPNRVVRAFKKAGSWIKRQLPSMDPKDLLPVGIEATRGVITLGNASTPELIVADFRRADGTYGIVPARSRHDLYKEVLGFKFQMASVRYVWNEEYQDPTTTTGRMVDEHIQSSRNSASQSSASSYLSFAAFSRLWRQLRISQVLDASRSRHATPSPNSRSQSRSRQKFSLDEETPVGVEFTTMEYAVERKILDASVLELSYHADVVGEVPDKSVHVNAANAESFDIGNGDLAPEWGIDLVVRGGFFRYGPWTDRQRVELQRAFFPPPYSDVEPFPSLQPGDKRLWTSFNIFVELRDETTLYIPFREASKNWLWDGQSKVPRPRKREPASIHVVAGDSSTISYIVPMVATANGYEPRMEINLDRVSITSTLNDIKILAAESCQIRGELPSPLKWNGEREWSFAVSFRQPVIYLLRDHINMFTDLSRDWTSGPPSDYFRFIPMIYAVEFELENFELNMYVNDHNIIDKPLLRDENALFACRGPRFRSHVRIPVTIFRPETTTISIVAEGSDISLSLSLPRWTTHTLHNPALGTRFARLGHLHLQGSYRYFAVVREDNVEQLVMEFSVRDASFKVVGWTIRYLMVLRENYVGTFTQFSTLNEYLDRRRAGLPVGDPIALKYRPGKANMLQVEMRASFENIFYMIPAGLPGYERYEIANEPSPGDFDVGTCIVLSVPAQHVHFRLHDYLMEMSLNIDDIFGCIEQHCPESSFHGTPGYRLSKETFMIGGIDITAHRLFGPQPKTSTYLCIWELHFGDIKGTFSASDGRALLAVASTFRLNFVDPTSAPAAEYMPPLDPDVTFLKMSIDNIDVTWLSGETAVVIAFPEGLQLTSNDRASQSHRKITSLRLPHACLTIVLATPKPNNWSEAMRVVADAYVDIYSSPSGWEESAIAQAEFVRAQDSLTGRAKVIFDALDTPRPSMAHMHRSSLFLPLPRLLDPSWSQATENMPARAQESTLTKRPPYLQHLSESEGEEGVSDADRDARLARTRTLLPDKPGLMNDEDQEMSSGDESDDEDLTDSDSSYSDRSESRADATKELLASYSSVTNHYMAHFFRGASTWDGPSLSIARIASEPSHLEPPTNGQEARENHEKDSWKPPVYREDDHRTFVRLECRRNFDVKVTPLLVPALNQLEQELESSTVSPEICVDSFMADYLSKFSSSRVAAGKVIMLSVCIKSAWIRSFVRVASTGSETLPNFEDPNGHAPLIMLELASRHLHIFASNVEDASAVTTSWHLTIGTDAASLKLEKLQERRGLSRKDSAISGTSVCRMEISEVTGNFGTDSLNLAFHNMSFELGHMAPECMATTGASLTRCSLDLARTHKRLASHRTSFHQHIISHLLVCSQDKPVVDPLSTIQPSYLIQIGRPHELRTDINFRFLFHLRSCLWHLDESERKIFSQHVADKPDVEITALLGPRLTTLSLDPDTSSLSHLTVLGTILPNLMDSPSTAPASSRVLALYIDEIVVTFHHPSCTAASKIAAAPFIACIRLDTPDLIRPLAMYPRTTSQTSLSEKGQQNVQHIVVSLSVGEVGITIFPQLMQFTQEALRVRRRYGNISADLSDMHCPEETPRGQLHPVLADVTILLRQLRVQAVAENLTFEVGLSGASAISGVLFRQASDRGTGKDHSMSHSLTFQDLFLRARSPADGLNQTDQDILASLLVSDGKANAVIREEPLSNLLIRGVWSVRQIQISVPRSAIRLYRFVEEWRADFLPGLEATLKALLSEVQKASSSPVSRHAPQLIPSPPLWQLHGFLGSFGVSLQVMHGTWLSWEVNHTTSYMRSSITGARRPSHAFGLQAASQVVSISSKPTQDPMPGSRMKLDIPTVSVTGHHDGLCTHFLATVEFFQAKLKLSHWDTLLAVQQKFGTDFHDFVLLMGETRRKQAGLPERHDSQAHNVWKYAAFLKMRGFRIGLESKSSAAYLQCENVDGSIDNSSGQTWHLKLSDLALSLSPIEAAPAHVSTLDPKRRTAFVTTSFRAGSESGDSTEGLDLVVNLVVTKIHAVMQPSSIGEVGDFVDHLQAQMLDRREQRLLELAAFKEKARQILQTFEVKMHDEQPAAESMWLNKYHISLSVNNIGVAFPLSFQRDLGISRSRTIDSTAVRAFLFAIKSITFGTNRGETGQATMKGFSFQFVSRFNRSVPSDFSGESHNTRNRLLYPEMTANLRSHISNASRQIWIGASVSGFILDLDSSIPDHIFSLIDVYREGKERVTRLTASIPRPLDSLDSTPPTGSTPLPAFYTSLPTSNILASLTFLSGKVRVYSGLAASTISRTRSLQPSSHEPTDEQFLESGAEILTLPVVSVWAEYRATPALHKLSAGREAEPSLLMFKGAIYSSENTLRPTLLPFLTELVSHVEHRLKTSALKASDSPPSATVDLQATSRDLGNRDTDFVSSMQINFSLRIDQSKLELTCQPDVNVIAGVHWDSGGFVVNVSPGARQVTFTGSVDGLTVGLKHGFLSEDCVRLDARNLGFSVTFAKTDIEPGNSLSYVSVVLDTEFSGVARFSRFQDVLCFQAVWLDRIPLFTPQPSTIPRTPLKTSVALPTPEKPPLLPFGALALNPRFTNAVLIRVRQIQLDIDLGQSISAVTLGLTNSILRTKLTEEQVDVWMSVANVAIVAKGNISGYSDVPNCMFQTIRRRVASVDGPRTRMLELRMTSDRLNAVLESDHQKLLQYRAEPLEIEIFDDWTTVSPKQNLEEGPLRLSFIVTGTDVVAVTTVGTIPKLMSYAQKFTVNLNAQREGASRESKAFRSTRTPKPDNPLSAVANAMLHNARSKFKEADAELSRAIRQTMSLRLKNLRFAVFPRTMGDGELAQFVCYDVRARLDRLLPFGRLPAKRDLHLSFVSMTISKFSQLHHELTGVASPSDTTAWLNLLIKDCPEAIIVGLPSMRMSMISEETVNMPASSKMLVYDFNSTFVRNRGSENPEDIYITLNMGLYSWLTVLRKNLSREMTQMQATGTWRSAVGVVPSPIGPPSRKSVDKHSSEGFKRDLLHMFPTPPAPVPPALERARSAPVVAKLPSSPMLGPEPASTSAAEVTPLREGGPSIQYQPRSRHIERLTMRQLGEATPDVMHPFFMKKAGFNLEDSLPIYVHEYATLPLEQIMEGLLKVYSKQLKSEKMDAANV